MKGSTLLMIFGLAVLAIQNVYGLPTSKDSEGGVTSLLDMEDGVGFGERGVRVTRAWRSSGGSSKDKNKGSGSGEKNVSPRRSNASPSKSNVSPKKSSLKKGNTSPNPTGPPIQGTPCYKAGETKGAFVGKRNYSCKCQKPVIIDATFQHQEEILTWHCHPK